jgi:hypothetical protein
MSAGGFSNPILGTPPYIPNLQSASAAQMSPAGSPYTLVTFTAQSRIWAAALSFSVSSSSAFTGSDGPFCGLEIGSGSGTLLICQLAVDGPSQGLSSDKELEIGGIQVDPGTSIIINVNNGTSVTDLFIRAGAVVLYTTP